MNPGYRAALEGTAVALRTDRARIRVTGRDPVGILQGIITNRVPEPAVLVDGVARGQANYAAVLTPKGRMVSDLRAVRGPREDEGLLLELPAAALPGLLVHLGKYVPPRLARARDVTAETEELTVVGPGAATLLSREALGLRIEAAELDRLAEDAWVWIDSGVLVMRGGELAAPSFDVLADRATAKALVERLREEGAARIEEADLRVLRLEAGRRGWGAELDENTLLPEAGIDGRAIDHTKGCYTGQEVIVRIRDRGHVNRRLCGLRLGEWELPAAGTELWLEGREKSVGVVTSAVTSPRAGGGLALGYVRREVMVPGEVRLGAPDGPRVQAVSAEGEWWRS